jgi:sulfatase maturation enzyme AslB (radical SAM superfamily)
MVEQLLEIKKCLLADKLLVGEMRTAVESLGKNPKRPLGKVNSWWWWLEPVHGCNLACVFCGMRLFKRNDWRFVSMETWRVTMNIIAELSPYGKIGIVGAGESTLHPDFYELARVVAAAWCSAVCCDL